MGGYSGTGTSENFTPRKINVGDSLRTFERPSIDALRVVIVANRPCLVKKVFPNEAEVLYRETRDNNQPSRGYLKLKDYNLRSEIIWSHDVHDLQDFGGDWDNQLESVGIRGMIEYNQRLNPKNIPLGIILLNDERTETVINKDQGSIITNYRGTQRIYEVRDGSFDLIQEI